MEIKATLNKPYSDKQRIDFIVAENHNKGYEIRETETALEAWGYTDEEIAEQQKQAQIKELQDQLDDIDFKCIRALRAIQAGVGTEADTAKLAELETQAEVLRKEIQDIINPPEETEQEENK